MEHYERQLVDVLRKYGEIVQARLGPFTLAGDPIPHVPVFVWRFREQDKFLDGFIIDAVETFKGNVQWTLEPGKRRGQGINTVLAPSRFHQLREQLLEKEESTRDLRFALTETEPDFVHAATADVPDLIQHIERTLATKAQPFMR